MKIPRSLAKSLGIVAKGKKRKREPKAKAKPQPLVGPPQTWMIVIPDYLPPSLAKLLHVHWREKHKLKKECAEFIAHYGRHVEKAVGKRRVLLMLLRPPGVTIRDADNNHKAILDGLVLAGILGGDSPEWVEVVPIVQTIGPGRQTVIAVEELP